MTKRQWFIGITLLVLVANPAAGVGLIALAFCGLAVLAIMVALGSLLSSNY